jgi:hypothetical protein
VVDRRKAGDRAQQRALPPPDGPEERRAAIRDIDRDVADGGRVAWSLETCSSRMDMKPRRAFPINVVEAW